MEHEYEQRADSPLDGQSTLRTLNHVEAKAPPTQCALSASPCKTSNPSTGGGGFVFIAVDPSKKQSNRNDMKEIHSFVMRRYLDRERSKPESERKDSRATKKRRVHDSWDVTALDSADIQAHSTKFVVGRDRHGHIPGPFLKTDLEQVPFPLSRFNGRLNPFNTWPTFHEPSIDVSKLKWDCSLYFGSRGLSQQWVPLLLSARHAFLSPITISTAHNDIMRRSSPSISTRHSHESFERTRVRIEVSDMISASLGDPELRLSDTTLVAVLHLLIAGIMECDDKITRIHQKYIYTMVEQRGDLNRVNSLGPLTSALTITMLMIAVLGETRPRVEFTNFARRHSTAPPQDLIMEFPESPVYCRPDGYVMLRNALKTQSPTYELLENLRELTAAFYAKPGRIALYAPHSTTIISLSQNQWVSHFWALRDRVFSHKPAEQLQFASDNDKYQYEALRLTAQIYTEALSNEIQFSHAAARLGRTARSNRSQSYMTSSPPDARSRARTPIHIQICDALLRTDRSDCWSHLSGVLFWISLVVSASIQPENLKGGHKVHRWDVEEEGARKCLTAIAVRTNIILSFDYPKAVMGMLGSMLLIQQHLGRDNEMQSTAWSNSEAVVGIAGACGPFELPPQGIMSFAMELREECTGPSHIKSGSD